MKLPVQYFTKLKISKQKQPKISSKLILGCFSFIEAKVLILNFKNKLATKLK